jgi:hypothetical protein
VSASMDESNNYVYLITNEDDWVQIVSFIAF